MGKNLDEKISKLGKRRQAKIKELPSKTHSGRDDHA